MCHEARLPVTALVTGRNPILSMGQLMATDPGLSIFFVVGRYLSDHSRYDAETLPRRHTQKNNISLKFLRNR